MESATTGMRGQVQGIEGALRPLALGLVAGGAAAVAVAAKFEKLKAGLTSTMGSAEAAEVEFRKLQKVAELPGLGLEEAVKGSLRLQGAGLSADQARESLIQFGNAVASSGGGKAELDGVSLALAQIAAKGKVSAEEINQITEKFYGIRVAMKAAFGTADTELLGKRGIGASEFIRKINQELSKLPRVAQTFANQLETLGDQAQIALGSIGQSLLPIATKALEGLAAATEAVTRAWTRMGAVGQGAVVTLGGIAVAAWASSAAFTFLKGAVVGVVGAVGNLVSVLSPALLVIGGLVAALYALDQIEGERQKQRDLNRALTSADDEGSGAEARWDRSEGWRQRRGRFIAQSRGAHARQSEANRQNLGIRMAAAGSMVGEVAKALGIGTLATAVNRNTDALLHNTRVQLGRQVLGGGVVGSHGVTATDLAAMRHSGRVKGAQMAGGRLWNQLGAIIQQIMQKEIQDQGVYDARAR